MVNGLGRHCRDLACRVARQVAGAAGASWWVLCSALVGVCVAESCVAETCHHPAGNLAFAQYGDVTGSGSVNVADAICIVIAALQVAASPSAPAWPACAGSATWQLDLDCDGAVTVADATLAARIAVGQGLPLEIAPAPDACPYACEPCVEPGGTSCLIGGSCVPAGELASALQCDICDPALDARAFVLAPDGTDCGAGRSCVDGHCVISPPGAPAVLTAAAGHTELHVTFEPPAQDGGAAITSYRLACDAAGSSAEVTGSASPLTLANLAPGTTYACTVSAINAAGEGEPSDALQITAASCGDGDQNGDEEGVDCGGQHCSPCEVDPCAGDAFCPAASTTVCGTVSVDSLHIPEGVQVTCAPGCTQPVHFIVSGHARVDGTLSMSGQPGSKGTATNNNPNGATGGWGGVGRCGGAGGGKGGNSPNGAGTVGSGTGGGGRGQALLSVKSWGTFYNGGNAGGGGFGTAGNAGAYLLWAGEPATGTAGAGGSSYGSATLVPLVGGSGGGGGSGGLGGASTGYGGGGGGAGGGAVWIEAAGGIEIGPTGSILADGGVGADCQNIGAVGAGGAGAGGAIRLSAPTVVNEGIVSAVGGENCYANGGQPHHGRGGVGRIRVDTHSGGAPPGSFTPAIGHTSSL